MANSMTGFGRGSAQGPGYTVTVELSTVNRKQFDATLWLPREWMALEARLLGLLREGIARGTVKCAVSVQCTDQTLALAGVAERCAQVRALAERLGVPGEVTIHDLVALCQGQNQSTAPEADETAWAVLAQATREALERLGAMRRHEGARIAEDLLARLERLHALYQRIAAIAPTLPAQHREALARRIETLTAGAVQLEPSILEREVALFADRCDISEELTRLAAHFAHARTLLSGEGACGRALDFLCQEFVREINTTGSKCASNEISSLVIAFKTLLETVREQVQNLE